MSEGASPAEEALARAVQAGVTTALREGTGLDVRAVDVSVEERDP